MKNFAFGYLEVPDSFIYFMVAVWVLIFILIFVAVAAISFYVLRKRKIKHLLKTKSVGIALAVTSVIYIILALK